MKYQVINSFIERLHKSILYKEGDIYPKAGFSADPERVAFLQSDKNKYKKAFLGPALEEKDDEEVEEKDEEQPEEKSGKRSRKSPAKK